MNKQKIIKTISNLIENRELDRLNNTTVITNEKLAMSIFNLFDKTISRKTMSNLDKFINEVEEDIFDCRMINDYPTEYVTKLLSIVEVQREALEFVAMQLTNKEGSVESFIETLNNDYDKCVTAMKQVEKIVKD